MIVAVASAGLLQAAAAEFSDEASASWPTSAPVAPRASSQPQALALPAGVMAPAFAPGTPATGSPAGTVAPTLASAAAEPAGGAAEPAGAPVAGPASLLQVDQAPLPVAESNGPTGFGEIGSVPFTKPENCGSFASSCQVTLDIFAPTGHGPFPTVVLVRGGPGGLGSRTYLDVYARELASLGVLVFNADYRDSTDQGGGYPGAFQDVACAVRFARSEAAHYGGDGGTVTLVGHSLGGWVGSVLALDPSEFDGGNCLAGGSGRPDAFVGLAGCYQLDAGDVVSDLAVFFGGYASQTGNLRAASDPFNYATGTAIPVRLVAGTSDTSVNPAASAALNSFLLAKDWNVSLTLVPGATHMTILRSDESGDASLQAVFSAIAAGRSNSEAIDPLKARWGD